MLPLYAELLDGIVDQVDTRADLWACALVSTGFYRAVARQLYQLIRLSVYSGAEHSEDRCKTLNSILEEKPYLLNNVRSLHVEGWVSAKVIDQLGGKQVVEECYPELVKVLLRLTHAQALEELKIETRNAFGHEFRVGFDLHEMPHCLLALAAVRCMPSLRRVELMMLENPQAVLVTGIPGQDQVAYMKIRSITYDENKAETVSNKSLDIPRVGPLAVYFQEAKADWTSILLVQNQLDAFKDAPQPLQKLEHLHLTSFLAFHNVLCGVQRRIYGVGWSGPSLPSQLTTFHYSYPAMNERLARAQCNQMAQAGKRLGQDCLQLRSLVLTLDAYGAKPAHIF